MILATNPTRMELLKLKRRIAIARRGHKLLKDKQDELMRKFLAMIGDTRAFRVEVEASLKQVFADFTIARSINSPRFMDAQLSAGRASFEVVAKKDRFLNLELVHFENRDIPGEPDYSFFGTSSDLDRAFMNFRKILPKMIKLAELEIKIKLISEEIKRTRRRVNALEYIFIPNLADTISYITMKLDELERSGLTRLMRVKEIIESAA